MPTQQRVWRQNTVLPEEQSIPCRIYVGIQQNILQKQEQDLTILGSGAQIFKKTFNPKRATSIVAGVITYRHHLKNSTECVYTSYHTFDATT